MAYRSRRPLRRPPARWVYKVHAGSAELNIQEHIEQTRNRIAFLETSLIRPRTGSLSSGISLTEQEGDEQLGGFFFFGLGEGADITTTNMTASGLRLSSTFPRILHLIATFLLASHLLCSVSARPVDELPDDPAAPFEDKYPDLEECRQKVKVDADQSMFYSKVGKHEEKPQRYADDNGLILVREAYPKGFTDKNSDPSWSGYKAFAMRFSQAFAEATSGTAHVMLPTDGKTDLSDSVWIKTEKPALVADDGKCNRIIKVDPDRFSRTCILWDRWNVEDGDIPICDKENGEVPGKRTRRLHRVEGFVKLK